MKHTKQMEEKTIKIRLNKFLSNAGVCSRRSADTLISSGAVKVNGEVVTEMGHKVSVEDEVLVNELVVNSEKKVYVLLNKPKNTVTTADDPQGRFTVLDLVRNACEERIYPVGRLDRNTTGVLLLTNDGELTQRLTHPSFEKKKIYHVHLDLDLLEADFESILNGIELEDGFIKADDLHYVNDSKKEIGIEIHSGRNRIVRRVFESLGYKVDRLDRVYFAGLTKYNLPRSKWRHLTPKEVGTLKMGAYE